MKKALITGITGQDGSYLAELLLEKGYEVYGVDLSVEKNKSWRISHILEKIDVRECDVSDEERVEKLVREIKPDECYHLASYVDGRVVFEKEKEIFQVNFGSTLYILRAIKEYSPETKFFFAGSSLMFGDVSDSPQNEKTPMCPNTPYGIAKTAAFHFVKMYREAYGVFACTGILYNHESPRRDFHFLPRKITSMAAKIKKGEEKELLLGNLDSKRDWGFAGDFARAMWMMVQNEKPNDYVIGTGELRSVKDLLDTVFSFFNLDWHKYVKIDESFTRKVDPNLLVADSSKIKEDLGWKPEVSFNNLIKMMTEEDARIVRVKTKE